MRLRDRRRAGEGGAHANTGKNTETDKTEDAHVRGVRRETRKLVAYSSGLHSVGVGCSVRYDVAISYPLLTITRTRYTTKEKSEMS